MGLLDVFRRKPPVADVAALADFIDQNAAFIVQRGIYEYSRARAGHYAKVLFAESGFREAVERSRWQAYPMGLAMLTELVEGILRPHAGEDRRAVLGALVELTLSVFDRYPVPDAVGALAWEETRETLRRDLDLIGTHPPKYAKDIPERFAEAYFDLMPIHETLRRPDNLSIRNYLRVTLCNMHDELTQRMDSAAMAALLRHSPEADSPRPAA